ncbi:hypothetical protein BCR35DRAFT_285517 [Leucosporidium creatinivorum]|uniref:Uncharacterized protein n=1 Tax=Leucosporidium creatinivorum TaxID=106004 RepID=A0A1Y2C4D7_9BASI|nr:hypothetical protein BCR35DRAFT_285517 [Leucosporidium creatinivorum]
MSAVYSIFTSPNHPPVPDHLPTLIVTPHGRPSHILYTYLHTNVNRENYLLTPSEAGDLCVAKLFPPSSRGGAGGSSAHSHGGGGSGGVKCEASRNLKWTISNTGIQNPVYKLTLPNPDQPQQDQPLFQVSKPNPNAGWWTLFYFTYAGHLIPPKRVEFGRIQKNTPESGGGTRVAITGKTEEEKAVWKTLGESNEDMVEWIVICAALVVLDDEIVSAAEKAGVGLSAGGPAGGMRMPNGSSGMGMGGKMRSPNQGPPPQLHATGMANGRPPPAPFGSGPSHSSSSRGPPPPHHQQHQPPPQPIRQGSVPVPPVSGYPLPPPMSAPNGHRPPPPSSNGAYQQQQQRPEPQRSHSDMRAPPPHHQQQGGYPHPQQDPRAQGARLPPPINTQHSYTGPSSAPVHGHQLQDPPVHRGQQQQDLPARGASSLSNLGGGGGRLPSPTFPTSSQSNPAFDPRYHPQQQQQGPPPPRVPSPLQPAAGRAPSSYRPGPPSQLQQHAPPSPGYAQQQPLGSGGQPGGAGRMLQAQVEARRQQQGGAGW